MKSLAQILVLASLFLFAGFGANALASPSAGGGPIVAQYSNNYGNNYGNSSNNYGSSTRTSYRSYRGLFKLGAFIIFLIVSGVGYLIRKMSGD